MPYNPGINYITPAEKTQQATQAWGQAAQAIGAGLDKARQIKEESEGVSAVASYLQETQPDIMTPERLAKFESGSLSAKKALLGEISVDVLRNYEQQSQDDKLASRTMTPEALAAFEGRTGYTYVNGQVVPLKGETASAELQFFTDPDSGERFYSTGNGVRQVRRPGAQTKPAGVAESFIIGNLTKGIGQIDSQIAGIAGSGELSGKRNWPDWMPGKTRQDEIAALESQKAGMQAQLDALTRGSGAASSQPASNTAGVLAEAKAAVAAGADPAIVAERLRKMGVDPAGL